MLTPERDAAFTTFTVTERNGIWGVTRNGAFWGHFRSRTQAMEAAAAAAEAVATTILPGRVIATAGFGRPESITTYPHRLLARRTAAGRA